MVLDILMLLLLGYGFYCARHVSSALALVLAIPYCVAIYLWVTSLYHDMIDHRWWL